MTSLDGGELASCIESCSFGVKIDDQKEGRLSRGKTEKGVLKRGKVSQKENLATTVSGKVRSKTLSAEERRGLNKTHG